MEKMTRCLGLLRTLIIFAFSFFFSNFSVFATDLNVRLLPSYNFLFKNEFKSNFGLNMALDIAPFSFRSADSLFFSVNGQFLPLKAKGISSYKLFDAGLSLGYDARIFDRLNASLEISAGLWSVNSDESDSFKGTSGFSYGTRLSSYYNFFPEFSAGAFLGYKNFASDKKAFLQAFEIGLSARYNFTKGLFFTSDVKIAEAQLENIFPVFYSHYADNSFGTVFFKNNEKTDITDVEISICIEQYMASPEICKKIERVKRGELFEAELTAFLSENILLNLEATKADAKITVSYKSLGRKISHSQNIEIQVLNRNNMTWEDDRRAAAFISAKDGGARFFANHVKSAVRNMISSSESENIQYAHAIFETLKLYGINYVVDASSSFTANVGTAQIDSLNFPYQTLLYHGGDCDDLTILNCALLESLGIDTALITVPGHIFMAFDSGLSPSKVNEKSYIIHNGKVWVPVEITLCQDSWEDERQYGLYEWNKYQVGRQIYPLKEAWELYKPIGIPDSNISIDVPSKAQIQAAFSK